MSRLFLLLAFFHVSEVNKLMAQPGNYGYSLYFKAYDKEGVQITPKSQYKVKPSFKKDNKANYPDSFSFLLDSGHGYHHGHYSYKFPASAGGGIVPQDFTIVIIHGTDSMIIDLDPNHSQYSPTFDSIPFIKGRFYIPHRWHYSLIKDKIFTGGDFYPLKWEDFEITKQSKPCPILYEKLYDASFEDIFFSPRPEAIKPGLYAVSNDFYNNAVIFKKSYPFDSAVIKTSLSLHFSALPIRFYQHYNKTFIYQENAGFLYYSEDGGLKNWKMAFFEASSSIYSGNYGDYGFMVKQIKISDEGYVMALGAIVFLSHSQHHGIPAWYRLHFDVEPGSEKYVELKEKVKQRIADYLQIK